jgi:hypothetical protein
MDSIFLDGNGSPLNLNDTVTWYSKRYRAWISGPITQLKASVSRWDKKPSIKITVEATYPGSLYSSSVVIKPSSVVMKSKVA